MALLKCPDCGREVSDKAAACPGCGCPVDAESSIKSADDIENATSDISDKPKRKKAPIIALSILFVLVIGIGVYFVPPYIHYRKAISYIESGEYSKAVSEIKSAPKRPLIMPERPYIITY